MTIVYLNGDYLPLAEAKISVLDRGFTFADSVYEVIPVFSGKIFQLDEHLNRLDNSLACLEISLSCSKDELKSILIELVRKNPDSADQQIYLQVSRGVSERDHHFDEHMNPTCFAMCKPVLKRDFSHGINAMTSEDIRWKYCHIKSTALVASVLLKKLARDTANSREAILIRDGLVTEGASSNVFTVKNGVIMTPRKDNNVLPGITRDLLVELLLGAGFDCRETDIPESELRQADEVWITSSTMGVVAVVKLDGVDIGDGTPGPFWQQANKIYESFKLNGPHLHSSRERVA